MWCWLSHKAIQKYQSVLWGQQHQKCPNFLEARSVQWGQSAQSVRFAEQPSSSRQRWWTPEDSRWWMGQQVAAYS